MPTGVVLHSSWVVCQSCGYLDFTPLRCCQQCPSCSPNPRPLYVKIPWDWEPVLEAAYRLGGIEAARTAVVTLRP